MQYTVLSPYRPLTPYMRSTGAYYLPILLIPLGPKLVNPQSLRYGLYARDLQIGYVFL